MTEQPHRVRWTVVQALTARIGDDATAAQTAAAFGVIWAELDAALAPIVGPRGVAALGQRSMRLASTVYPWLTDGQPGEQALLDPALLVPLLAQRRREEAQAASNALLQTFDDLLCSLIGPSLTERLLHAVWTSDSSSPLNRPTGQDLTP